MAKHYDRASIRDGRKPGWFYVDNTLIDHYGSEVGAIGVAIYAALARHANANAQAAVGYDRLASSLAVSRNTVITKLRKLADEGLITIEPQIDSAGNPIAANIYTLCIIPEQNGKCDQGGVPTVAPPVPIIGTPHATIGQGVPTVAPPVPTVDQGGYQQLHAKESTTVGVGDHVGVGDRARDEKTESQEFIRQLCARRAQGKPMNIVSAQRIAALVAAGQSDEPTILASLDALIADNETMSVIIGLLNNTVTIPPKGQPYEHRPLQPDYAPDRQRPTDPITADPEIKRLKRTW